MLYFPTWSRWYGWFHLPTSNSTNLCVDDSSVNRRCVNIELWHLGIVSYALSVLAWLLRLVVVSVRVRTVVIRCRVFLQGFHLVSGVNLLSLVVKWGIRLTIITSSWWRNASSKVSYTWLILSSSTNHRLVIRNHIQCRFTNMCPSPSCLSSYGLSCFKRWLNLSSGIRWWLHVLYVSHFSFGLVGWYSSWNFSVATVFKILWRLISILESSVRLYAMCLCIDMLKFILVIILLNMNLLCHLMYWKTRGRRR